MDARPVLDLLPAPAHQPIQAGEILCYEGDPPADLIYLAAGQVSLRWGGRWRGAAQPGSFLDPAASLGGLPHTVKATVEQAGEVWRWSLPDLSSIPGFDAAARRYLAQVLQHTQSHLADVAAPVHYDAASQISPGPFRFDDTILIIAFCEADLDPISALLPDDLSLIKLPTRRRAPLFIGLADFPTAYPEENPEAAFAYTETTIFVPVWHAATPGVFIPYIYPSGWEPILIGREVYGFPKRSGHTQFSPNHIRLHVDQQPHLDFRWGRLDSSPETALVGGLMNWLGIQRQAAQAAFQAGEVLRKVMGAPAQRRVDAFLHKRIPAVDSTVDAPCYAVDQLTHTVFGVLRWFQVAKMRQPQLEVLGGPLLDTNLTLIEAYRTHLDMRLSRGEVLRDYDQS